MLRTLRTVSPVSGVEVLARREPCLIFRLVGHPLYVVDPTTFLVMVGNT